MTARMKTEQTDLCVRSVDGRVRGKGNFWGRAERVQSSPSLGKLFCRLRRDRRLIHIRLQVTNQMLSLTGSLLADPTNPPVPPESPEPVQHASPSLSPEPMNVEPPMAQPRYENTRRATGPVTYDAELQPQPEAAIEHEVMDERFLSARELKKRRKDEKREKRDERTVKKNEKVLEAVEAAGGGDMVGMKGIAPDAVGKKRKANGDIAKIHPKKTKGEV